MSEKRPVTAELTPREREIAALLVEGKTSKVIARETDLSPRTVEMHRAKLMRKFSASTSSASAPPSSRRPWSRARASPSMPISGPAK